MPLTLTLNPLLYFIPYCRIPPAGMPAGVKGLPSSRTEHVASSLGLSAFLTQEPEIFDPTDQPANQMHPSFKKSAIPVAISTAPLLFTERSNLCLATFGSPPIGTLGRARSPNIRLHAGADGGVAYVRTHGWLEKPTNEHRRRMKTPQTGYGLGDAGLSLRALISNPTPQHSHVIGRPMLMLGLYQLHALDIWTGVLRQREIQPHAKRVAYLLSPTKAVEANLSYRGPSPCLPDMDVH
ncbi:hypothetical protein SODALDRAFT_376902 [Sodiomyces alkalinus F11]|uniref:Uncharacterized protein n=1 Tax=Sodiomyces alkalinus (strain CBS 110278 / VKM F-3762 / F11) TaxID=1314773 RepID=A0A3N2Q363_SODAK|nr:hypothetical protein SODALDRAFT_376902 [Sodiomyces alkalinus F11]ROT41203.1 hypothetical protein SODALDRAFT_376902 [Sodiomyces alkalinus F11]